MGQLGTALAPDGAAAVLGMEVDARSDVVFRCRVERPRRTLAVGETATRTGREASDLVLPDEYVVGRASVMRKVLGHVASLASIDAPVLLLGETGVGKDVIARALHESSRRRRGPFVAVNCAAIPADLAEAELFGIERGVASGVVERAGQFQRASGGTLFLDELAELTPPLQAKLLRALEGYEVQPLGGRSARLDVRVIAATNADLEGRMKRAQFRRDLYYRVAAFVVGVPALRERPEDIPELVRAFADTFAREAGWPNPTFEPTVLRALVAHNWPGNVRELQNEVRRLVHQRYCDGRVDAELLTRRLRGARTDDSDVTDSLCLADHVARVERRVIREALVRCGWKRTRAARLLGISRNGLAIKMQRLGLCSANGESVRGTDSSEAVATALAAY